MRNRKKETEIHRKSEREIEGEREKDRGRKGDR